MSSRFVDAIRADGVLVGHVSTTRACEFTNADGSAHTVLKDFTPLQVQGVRVLDDGELLASVAPQVIDTGIGGQLWKTAGYPTLGAAAPWNLVLEAAHDQASFSFTWSFHMDGPIGVVAEYGGKTPPKCGSKAYVTEDYGDTWREVYDAGQLATNLHMHACAYDSDWDRMWLVRGDDPHQTVMYSDDWRDPTPTWSEVFNEKVLLGVLPMPGAIVFHTDDEPSGIWSIERLTDEDTGEPLYRQMGPMTHVHTIALNFTRLGMQMYRRDNNSPGFIAYKVTDGQTGAGVLVATYDGLTFHNYWIDDYAPYSGGLYHIVGPTDDGKLIGTAATPRGSLTRIVMDAPTWEYVEPS